MSPGLIPSAIHAFASAFERSSISRVGERAELVHERRAVAVADRRDGGGRAERPAARHLAGHPRHLVRAGRREDAGAGGRGGRLGGRRRLAQEVPQQGAANLLAQSSRIPAWACSTSSRAAATARARFLSPKPTTSSARLKAQDTPVGQPIEGVGTPQPFGQLGVGQAMDMGSMLGMLGMIKQAYQSGNVQISHGEHVIDMRGTADGQELREQLMAAMQQAGVDPEQMPEGSSAGRRVAVRGPSAEPPRRPLPARGGRERRGELRGPARTSTATASRARRRVAPTRDELGRGERVLPGVWRLRLPLPWENSPHGNAYAVSAGDGIVLVDTGYAGEDGTRQLEFALAQVGWGLDDIRLVVCTHTHADHYGLAGPILDAAGCELWMHPAWDHVRPMVEDPSGTVERRLELARLGGVPEPVLESFRAARAESLVRSREDRRARPRAPRWRRGRDRPRLLARHRDPGPCPLAHRPSPARERPAHLGRPHRREDLPVLRLRAHPGPGG